MSTASKRVWREDRAEGVRAVGVNLDPRPVAFVAPDAAEIKIESAGKHGLAFFGVFLFTILLYTRPHDLWPEVFGDTPIIKYVAIPMIVIYIISKLARAEQLTIWPKEVKLVGFLVLISVLFTPIATEPDYAWTMLTEVFLKVVAVFILMLNLLDTRERLRMMLNLVVICGTYNAFIAIQNYLAGKFESISTIGAPRVEGAIGGMFGNANDFAAALNMVLPIAIALALTTKGLARLFYFACVAILSIAVVVSFSRGGFLTLIAMGGFMLWKVGRNNRATTVLAALLLFGVFSLAMPNAYGDRLFTILNTEQDATGSAQERQALMARAFVIAIRHPVTGIGIGNIGAYMDKVTHNSYIEIAAELGAAGLIAYLMLIFAPLRSLKRLEQRTQAFARSRDREFYYLSLGIHATIIGYIISSFFASYQYFWYLYYPVAYAIALRRLEGGEEVVSQEAQTQSASQSARAGLLWEQADRAGK
ncbi:MAG TPA: O-antigen ligase family protein [Blastocatellia bacterium]|nr:O-antigen ligase family protein [Blastocatellia bacterium]